MSSRLRRTSLVLAFALAALAAAVACGDDRPSTDFGGISGDGSVGSLPEAGVGGGDAEAPAATMRLAHLAADVGPIDFCWQVAGTGSFEGPVLGRGRRGAQDDAGEGGLPEASIGDADAADASTEPFLEYRAVSRYLELGGAGPLTFAIVEAGASSCAAPILVEDVTLDPGKLVTVALLGARAADAGTPSALGLAAFVDDRDTVPDKARVRVVHAAEGAGAISVRAVSAKAIPLADRVEPRRAATPSAAIPVDALGYATIAALPPPAALAVVPVEGDDAGPTSGWQSAARDLGLRGGSLHTAFVLAGAGQPFEIVWCADTSTDGDRAACTLVR